MPSVAQEAHDGRVNNGNNNSNTNIFSKKRRRDDLASVSSFHGLHNASAHTPPYARVAAIATPPATQRDLSDHSVVAILVHADDNDNSRQGHEHGDPSSNAGHEHLLFPGNPRLASHDGVAETEGALFGASHRKILPMLKRQRLDGGSDGDGDGKLPALSRSETQTQHDRIAEWPHPNASTAPCHICHRRPRRKCDLDSLADCEGCGQRTCFVCLRECFGWVPAMTTTATRKLVAGGGRRSVSRHVSSGSFTMTDACPINEDDNGGDDNNNSNIVPEPGQEEGAAAADGQHRDGEAAEQPGTGADEQTRTWSAGGQGHRRMICSQCCVERGADGDVVCLGCLPFVEG